MNLTDNITIIFIICNYSIDIDCRYKIQAISKISSTHTNPERFNLPFAELAGVRPGEEREPLGPT